MQDPLDNYLRSCEREGDPDVRNMLMDSLHSVFMGNEPNPIGPRPPFEKELEAIVAGSSEMSLSGQRALVQRVIDFLGRYNHNSWTNDLANAYFWEDFPHSEGVWMPRNLTGLADRRYGTVQLPNKALKIDQRFVLIPTDKGYIAEVLYPRRSIYTRVAERTGQISVSSVQYSKYDALALCAPDTYPSGLHMIIIPQEAYLDVQGTNVDAKRIEAVLPDKQNLESFTRAAGQAFIWAYQTRRAQIKQKKNQ